MIEKIKRVSNPLTIIAIFAGLAEVSGTGILPFIAEANQVIYIWFLMIFPAYLVALFFLTLNFNPRVLYAPSDFRDEENYMKIFRPSSAAQIAQKLKEESEEIEQPEQQPEAVQGEDEQPRVISSQTQLVELMKADPRARYTLAEALVIDRLEKEFRTPGRRDMSLRSKYGQHMFDAVFETKEGLRVVEIKLFSRDVHLSMIRKTISRIQSSLFALPEKIRRQSKAILAIAYDMPEENVTRARRELESILLDAGSSIELRMYPLAELLQEVDKK